MAEENILTAGLEACKELRGYLIELIDVKKKSTEAASAIALNEKAIKVKEKAVNDEISSTVKKRTEEIENSYDDEIEKLKSRSKKVKSEKVRTKDQKVAIRIENETKPMREKARQFRLDIRSIYKRDNVPSIFNTKLFYSMFMPRTLWEYILFFLVAALLIVGIPSGVFFFAFPDKWKTYLGFILLYTGCVIIFLAIYICIAHFTKEKHRDTFIEIRSVRAKIRANRKDIAAIKRKVRKDKDESAYGLHEYDDEMKGISNEIAEVLEEKKEALKDFEVNAKEVLTENIREKSRAELEELKATLNRKTEEQKTADARSKELTLLLAKNYEAYLGKENLNIETVDKLIAKLEFNFAQTVKEALDQIKEEEARAGTETTGS